MNGINRNGFDRRVGRERRSIYRLEYFTNEEAERRSWSENRQRREQRDDWLRYTVWGSVFVGK